LRSRLWRATPSIRAAPPTTEIVQLSSATGMVEAQSGVVSLMLLVSWM
jgi:hypothetical protein